MTELKASCASSCANAYDLKKARWIIPSTWNARGRAFLYPPAQIATSGREHHPGMDAAA